MGLYYNGHPVASINPKPVLISMSEYEQLSAAEKNSGTVFLIPSCYQSAEQVVKQVVKKVTRTTCEACGAPLTIIPDQRIAKCEYCGSTYNIDFDYEDC